jgi:hypothetical protein
MAWACGAGSTENRGQPRTLFSTISWKKMEVAAGPGSLDLLSPRYLLLLEQ